MKCGNGGIGSGESETAHPGTERTAPGAVESA